MRIVFFLCAISMGLISCENDEAEVDCTLSDLSLNVTGNEEVDCSTGAEIVLIPSGGIEPYLFSFNESGFQQSEKFVGIGLGGPYVAKVKDGNGCVASTQLDVTGGPNSLSASLISQNAGCGTSNGVITVEASGGAGDYSYKFENESFGLVSEFTNLSRGTYRITTMDADNCNLSQTILVSSGISYDTDVKSIIANSCATSGCHVSGTGRANFTSFSTVQSNAASIKIRTKNKTMPKEGSLTDVEIEAIACWVDDGALDN